MLAQPAPTPEPAKSDAQVAAPLGIPDNDGVTPEPVRAAGHLHDMCPQCGAPRSFHREGLLCSPGQRLPSGSSVVPTPSPSTPKPQIDGTACQCQGEHDCEICHPPEPAKPFDHGNAYDQFSDLATPAPEPKSDAEVAAPADSGLSESVAGLAQALNDSDACVEEMRNQTIAQNRIADALEKLLAEMPMMQRAIFDAALTKSKKNQ